MARPRPLPSFLSTKRSRVITLAAAGALAMAAAISVAAGPLPSSSLPASARADMAFSVTISPRADASAARPIAGDGARQVVLFDQARAAAAQRQRRQQLAAAKAAPPARQLAVTTPSGSPEQIAEQMLGGFGWSASQFACLQPLWERESGWDVTAQNPSSGAYGIPQALPGSQMASAGPDWETDAGTQIRWGLTYIQGRYGSPCGAWAHEEADGWY